MSYQGDYGDGQPPQYPQDYGRQYPQDKLWQPQENDPFAYTQNPGGQQGTGGQQHPQQVPPWDGAQGSQQQPYGQPWPPQSHQYLPQVPRQGSSRPACRRSPSRSGSPGPPGTRCSLG